MQRSSRSARRSAPASTSSRTARFAEKATRTNSQTRSPASTAVGSVRSWAAPAARFRCRSCRDRSNAQARRGARRRVPARAHRPHDQDHAAGPVHDGAASRRRVLQGRRELALAYAEAVNEEVHDLFAAGADVVQLDEPWLQARAKQRAATASRRSTAPWQACRHDRAALVLRLRRARQGQAFERLLVSRGARRIRGDQISIEAAQPKLDLSILRALPSKTVMVGVLDLNDRSVETAEAVASRIRRRSSSCRRSG